MKNLQSPTSKVRYTLILFSFLFYSFGSTLAFNTSTRSAETSDKGLFSIQFSWNKESYSENLVVEIEYKRKAFLSKAKSSGSQILLASKNDFINLELREGEYEFVAIKLKGLEIGYNKYLRIPIEESFTVKPGIVTNGGLMFLVRESKKSQQVLTLKIDNTPDVKRYVTIYKPEFNPQIEAIEQAWKFIENTKVDKMVTTFAKALVARENKAPRPKVKYMYTTLGMVFKMDKDAAGKVTNYKLIKTPTYQQITKMSLKNNKLTCTLANGSFLYGDENGLEYMSLPKALEKIPSLYVVDDQFLLVDSNFNIFWADNSFTWTAQSEFRHAKTEAGKFFSQPSYPIFYKGKYHIYIYSKATGKQKLLLRSDRKNIKFEKVALSNDVKRVPMVTETSTKIILGPDLKLNATAKRPAYLYVKDHDGDTWEVRNLPRGDCNVFSPGKDETIFFTKCDKKYWYQSDDYGKTWFEYKAKK